MEELSIQKELGEIERVGSKIQVKKFGTESVVGSVSLLMKSVPVDHYVANRLRVGRQEQGKGFASQILSEVERISRESGMPIVLHDAIDPNENKRAEGMYAKRSGWTEILNSPRTFTERTYVYGDKNNENVSKLVQYFSSLEMER